MQRTTHRTPLAVRAIVILAAFIGSLAGVAAAQKPAALHQEEVMELLKSAMPSRQLCKTLNDRGIDFDFTPEVERAVRRAGASAHVVAALKRAGQRRGENGKPQTGVLAIKTSPGEAEVYWDGELRGKSSPEGELRLPDLQPGTHMLRVSLSGYQSSESTRTVAVGEEQSVRVDLLKTPAPAPANPPPANHGETTANSALPIPGVKLAPVQFYEGPVDRTLEESQRDYQCTFDRFTTRAVYWELDLTYPPPGRRIDFQVDIIWYKSDGTAMSRQSVSAYVLPSWGSSWETLGFGYVEPGYWLPGTYRVEIFFRNSRIAGGTFQIN